MGHRPPRRRSSIKPASEIRLVFWWDLDKTYLKTEFDSLRNLVRIPFERAEDKVAAPGVTALIRAVRAATARRRRHASVFFISASPPQIGRAIRRKLEIDGIVYEGIVFKNQLQRIMRGKFRHLREQVGFKLTELLKARKGMPPDTREYLFGDDWESDPLIYSLYADVTAGRLGPERLTEFLQVLRVDRPLTELAGHLAADISPGECVARIFINLDRHTPPARFRGFGPRLVPTFNYLQTAACLYEDGILDPPGVVEVARSLRDVSGYRAIRLVNSLADIARRRHILPRTLRALHDQLVAHELVRVRKGRQFARLRAWWDARQRRHRDPPPVTGTAAGSIDYAALIAAQDSTITESP